MSRAIHLKAIGILLQERTRQFCEKGYTYEHDDAHVNEELAAAAAFYLVPQRADVEVATGIGAEYAHQHLTDLIAENAWGDLARDFDDPAAELDLRIDTVARGVSLGLAELERLLRLQEVRDA